MIKKRLFLYPHFNINRYIHALRGLNYSASSDASKKSLSVKEADVSSQQNSHCFTSNSNETLKHINKLLIKAEQSYSNFEKEKPAITRLLLFVLASIGAYLIDSWIKERSENLATLKEIKSSIEQQWLENFTFLDQLQLLESQSRLYLYSVVKSEILEKHANDDKFLSRKLELNEHLGRRINNVRSSFLNMISSEVNAQKSSIQEDLIEQNQQLKIAYTLNKAVWLQKQKRFKQAEEIITNAIKDIENYKKLKTTNSKPTYQHIKINSVLATAYNIKAKIERCLAGYNINNLDNSYLQASKLSYEEALKNDKDNPILLNSLGFLLIDMGRPQEALEWHEKANQIKPNDKTILEGLGFCLHMIEKNKHDRGEGVDQEQLNLALARLTRSLQLENSCLVYNYRACLLKDMGNLDGALEDFNAALNLDNTHPIAICNRGRTYSELGKCREALKDLNKAFAIHADDRKKIMEINALIEKTRIQCAHKSIFRPW